MFKLQMYKEWSFKLLSTIGVLLHLIFIDIPKDIFRYATLKQKSVRDQVIVITGGGSGLGRRMAELFSIQHGAVVAVIDINMKGAEETVAKILKEGGRARAWKCDISNEQDMKTVAKEIESELGDVDIVICNAAVLAFRMFMELSSEELKKSFDVNVLGTINTIRAFLGGMEQRNSGHIVAVASIAGYYGETYGLGYCPSKFAVRGTMECLQMELRDMGLNGIKCTTLCPYFARTPMVLDAGLRPTCTWFPFMSIDSCSRRMVDGILKEKWMAFIPDYVTILPMTKGLLTNSASRTLRDYMSIKYQPSAGESKRQLLPVVPDYFEAADPAPSVLVLLALLVNYVAWTNPALLNSLPVAGPVIVRLIVSFPSLPLLTNIFALLAHLGEAIFAMVLCDRARFSFACSCKWFAQTLLFGYPSLRLLVRQVNKQAN